MWDLRKPDSPVQEYTGHTQDTTACVFISDEEGPVGGGRRWAYKDIAADGPAFTSRMIATASKDETIKIYDESSGVYCCRTAANIVYL